MRIRSFVGLNLLASLVLILSGSFSVAQDQPLETAEVVQPGVHHVSSGGFWSDDGVEGFYRVIIIAQGIEHVSHRLFVQWMRSDASTQAYSAVRTIGIKEIDFGPGHLIDVTTSFGDLNAFKIAVTVRDRAGKEKNFMITAKDVGQYDIRQL